MAKVFYKDLIIEATDSVYEPREDSFLMAENLKVNAGEKVLEIGTGSGILAILAAMQGGDVTATDINEEAIECAQKNANRNGAGVVRGCGCAEIKFLCGDLFEPVKNEKFDSIIFNPPYLPREEKYIDKKIDLSYNSSETLERFLHEYKNYLNKNGRALIVNSSISGVSFKGKIIAEEKLAFEKIEVIEI